MTASILFLLAGFFYLVAGLGLVRLPDSLARLHAGTKASSLATTLALAAALLHHRDPWSVTLALASILFVFLTAPLASHAIGRTILASRLPANPRAAPNAPKNPHPNPPRPAA